MARPKRESARRIQTLRDLRDHFAELCEGDVALTRRATPGSLDIIARNQDAWYAYMAITRAIRRGSTADRALLHQLRSKVDSSAEEIERRRARFAALIEAAINVVHSTSASTDEMQEAVMQVAAAIEVERARSQRADGEPWDEADSDGYSNWPLKQIRAVLDESKLPDAKRPRNKRGGRATFGVTATAAKLSRRFALFGDDKTSTNAAAAKKFAKARLRPTKTSL